jgi:hypothetical protein
MKTELERTWNEVVVAVFVAGIQFRNIPSEAEENINCPTTIGVGAETWIETIWIRDRVATNLTSTFDFWSTETSLNEQRYRNKNKMWQYILLNAGRSCSVRCIRLRLQRCEVSFPADPIILVPAPLCVSGVIPEKAL